MMDTSVKNTELNLALQVALQTMKERCVALQKRLAAAQEENQELRTRIEDKKNCTLQTNSNGFSSGAAELFQLRLQLSEMQREKTQITDHLNMVSEENRSLWSRLSQLAKEHEHILGLAKEQVDDMVNSAFTVSASQSSDDVLKVRGAAARAALAHQNLIRSKTFTQHSPNPNLRHKLLLDQTGVQLEDHLSLEDVTLGAVETEADSDSDTDYDMDVKKCFENMEDLQREVTQQQSELNTTLSILKNKLASIPCAECLQRAQKPEMADKSLETDESLSELQKYNNKNDAQINHSNKQADCVQTTHLNIMQEKIQADAMDKTCPMCGRNFTSIVSFDAFRNHVEQHFIDDSSDVESSIDRNFEFVSQSVGDF